MIDNGYDDYDNNYNDDADDDDNEVEKGDGDGWFDRLIDDICYDDDGNNYNDDDCSEINDDVGDGDDNDDIYDDNRWRLMILIVKTMMTTTTSAIMMKMNSVFCIQFLFQIVFLLAIFSTHSTRTQEHFCTKAMFQTRTKRSCLVWQTLITVIAGNFT